MIRPPVFLGELVDVGLDCPQHAAIVTASLPLGDIGRFLAGVGVPPIRGEPGALGQEPPTLVLMACRRPEHPETDDDVILRAAFGVLIHILGQRQVAITPTIVGCVEGLITSLRRHPDFAVKDIPEIPA